MMSVNRPDQPDPRANQRARTREAIVDAARELRNAGTTPTVEQAAEKARVSRATAYRYFPTKESLQIELFGSLPGVAEVEAALANMATDDVEERLLLLVDSFDSAALAEQEPFRVATIVAQDMWLRSHRNGDQTPHVRERRRMKWLEQVLAPLDLPPERKRFLKAALALTLGTEPMIVMKDVCRLDDDDALAVLRWAALAILRTALQESPTKDLSRYPAWS
jgi:AcrR family transcriptional regulator